MGWKRASENHTEVSSASRQVGRYRVDPWCQMLETFHQFREPPFGVNPDPRFLYLSRTHREAFSSLLYRIEMDSGFLAMVAQPGMGKTTLLFHLLQQLQPKARTAFIFHTQCTSSELLRHLLSEFECRSDTTDPVRVVQELKSMLVAEAAAGRRCVLVVDEAQNLGPDVLETIRLLSNFETPRKKLLNIVLSGQSELGEMLARAELRQLRQRLSRIIHLDKFTPEETAHYIAHRLAIAGYSGELDGLFSADAVARIAKLSEGVPRVINNLCFNALSLSYALGASQIDVDLVEEAALDLGLSGKSKLEDSDIDERKDVEAMREWFAAFRGNASGGVAFTTQAAGEIANREIDDQSKDIYARDQSEGLYGPDGGHMPAAVEPGGGGPDRSIAVSSRRRGKQREAVMARGIACLLVLLLTPAIDWPANPSVSAKAITIPSGANPASVTDLVASQPERDTSHTKHARVPRRRYLKHQRHNALQVSTDRDERAPVDLRLASFAPEPLLQKHPLQPMPLSEREHEVGDVHQTRVPEPTGFDVASRPESVASYVPPRPVSQPAPSIPAWYRHPKEDIQLLLAVTSSGTVSDVGILKGKGALAYSAKRAAMMWKYQPALANGKPVNSKVIVTVEFLQH